MTELEDTDNYEFYTKGDNFDDIDVDENICPKKVHIRNKKTGAEIKIYKELYKDIKKHLDTGEIIKLKKHKKYIENLEELVNIGLLKNISNDYNCYNLLGNSKNQ